jgi:calcium channel MID1
VKVTADELQDQLLSQPSQVSGYWQRNWTNIAESFPCPLVHSLDICPGVTYAAPLIGPDDGSPLTTLPDEYTDLLVSNLQAFSSSLLSSACGRDLYSHVSTCADCYDSYRDWLCRTVLPQCTVASTSVNSTIQTITRSPAVTRVEGLPNPPYEYTQLKPCLSVCNTADRDCPAFLEFRCPIRGVTADKSYSYQGEDDEDEGLDGTGFYDGGIDQWGQRWCNGPMPKDA